MEGSTLLIPKSTNGHNSDQFPNTLLFAMCSPKKLYFYLRITLLRCRGGGWWWWYIPVTIVRWRWVINFMLQAQHLWGKTAPSIHCILVWWVSELVIMMEKRNTPTPARNPVFYAESLLTELSWLITCSPKVRFNVIPHPLSSSWCYKAKSLPLLGIKPQFSSL